MFEKGELHRKLPFMLSSLMWENQPSLIAPVGQASAQVPQSMQESASNTSRSSHREKSPAGHSLSHVPQLTHSSEITYAIVISSFNLFSSLMITGHRVNRNPFWDMSLF